LKAISPLIIDWYTKTIGRQRCWVQSKPNHWSTFEWCN